MKLTDKQIINIIDNKLIDDCTEEEKEQVMNFAFGEEYMKSSDKGSRKLYLESLNVNLVKSVPPWEKGEGTIADYVFILKGE